MVLLSLSLSLSLQHPEPLTLTYTDEGAGPPVIFLCGGGTDVEYAATFLHAIARHFRVIALNYPGFMGSSPAEMPLTNEYFSTLVGAFADALGLSQFMLSGYSMGGGIAVNYAIENPTRVDALVLFSPVLYADLDSLLQISAKVVWNHLASRLSNKRIYPGMWQLFRAGVRRRQEVLRHVRFVQRFALARSGRPITPTLAIIGTRDHILDSMRLTHILEKFPHKKIMRIEGGHDSFLGKMEEVVREVERFVLS